jgi:hypothetical protein
MRWSGTAAILGLALTALALASPAAMAQSTASASAVESSEVEASSGEPGTPPVHVGYGAMPGGLHTATAEVLPPGTFEIAGLSGYGYRKGLANSSHTFNRAVGDIAFAYAPARNVMVGLSFDGRIDLHSGLMDVRDPMTTSDDSAVGVPQLTLRASTPVGKLTVGGQIALWAPGEDFPSFEPSALSVDALGLVTVDAGFGHLSLDAGFRFDNSAKTAKDSYSLGDAISLGVSGYNAALAGATLQLPVSKKAYVALEGSLQAFVGSGAPGPIVRGGATAGIALGNAWTGLVFVELAHVPAAKLDMESKLVQLVPFEPMVTAGVGLQVRLGGGTKPVAASRITRNELPVPVVVVETADVNGTVVDDAGKPVVGAKVTVKLKNNTGTTVTDDKGGFSVPKLPIGKTVDGKTDLDDTGAEVSAEVSNKKPGSATLTLIKGVNTVPRIVLDPMLPPGQLRAQIINLSTSRPVGGATVTIEPGGLTMTSDEKGKLQVDLAPGHYKLTVTARGLAQQQLDVNIDPNGVAIKNIELHK